MLAVIGELNPAAGGESAEYSDDNLRRTVYIRVGRYQQNETLALFDFPSTSVHVEKRAATNVPLQKLFFLNSGFVRRRSAALAGRIEQMAPDPALRLQAAHRLLFHRPVSSGERQQALAFVERSGWEQYAQVLLSTNEFLYVD
jgi:hypothetical protein